jgi:hypothetical protein
MVSETPGAAPSSDDAKMPWTSAAAFLAEVVDGGGSGGRTLDVREREGGGWDVVLLLDGGYADREEAVGSMQLHADYLRRAYVAEVEAGRIDPASDADLAKIGLQRTDGQPER